MKFILSVLFTALAITTLAAQDQPTTKWKQDNVTDSFRGTSHTRFTLEGKFLTVPKRSNIDKPLLVVSCLPGSDHRGHTKGKFISAYVATGAVMDSDVENGSSVIRVQFRLDDGKIQERPWSRSTDFSAIFMKEATSSPFNGSGYEQFANLLYGHETYHKENTNPQIRKVLLDVPEFLGGEIVMEFDLPDSTDVADACGIIWHK